MTCTSTWRAAGTKALQEDRWVAEGQLGLAPRRGERSGAAPPGSRTTRMPRPPPPAVALSTTGYPSRAACAAASAGSSTGPPPHGTTGTSAFSASRFAVTLSPSARIVALSGPTKTMPASSHRCANEARSATNPQPDPDRRRHRASTSAPTTAASSR